MKVQENSRLYNKIVKNDDIAPKLNQMIQWFDSYTVNPMLSYFTLMDIAELKKISETVLNIKEKYAAILRVMNRRGFVMMKGGGGTNRRTYECSYDPRIIAKVALDSDGQNATLRDFKTQNILKPFCTKVFETDPSGTLSIVERVVPIMTKDEWAKYAGDIFEVMWYGIRNRDIGIEDAGDSRIKNWGYRNGFGPVILDFPCVYRLDPTKNHCKKIINGHVCGGTIDYDEGFNRIHCTECGEEYFAKSFALKDDECLNSLGQANGYNIQKNNMNQEMFSMKFTITNYETGEVIAVKETGSRKKNVKQEEHHNFFENTFSTSYEEKPELVKPKFKFTVNFVDLNGNSITDNDNIKTEEPEVISEPPVSIQLESDEILLSNEYSQINNVLNGKQPSLQEMINEFDKVVNDTVIEYEYNGNKDVKNICSIIKTRMYNGNSFMDTSELFNMFREVSIATLYIPDYDYTAVINDDILESTNSTLIGNMIDKIYGGVTRGRFMLFESLVNTVKNTASFFEGVISFYRYITNTFCYDTDEQPGGTIEYKLNKSVYDIMMSKIKIAIEDYIFNVSFNHDNLTYSMPNAFSFFKSGLEELEKLAFDESDIWEVLIIKDKDSYEIAVQKKEDDIIDMTSSSTDDIEPVVDNNNEPAEDNNTVSDTEETTIDPITNEPLDLFDAYEEDNSFDKYPAKQKPKRTPKKVLKQKEELKKMAASDESLIQEEPIIKNGSLPNLLLKGPIFGLRQKTKKQKHKYDINGSTKKYGK